tara:strand:+ start:199 stop:810 length:612 start_codon:yes stop_codon:yes gene_type:complete
MSDFIHTIQMNDTTLCDDLLKYYHENSEYKQVGESNGGNKTSTDVTVHSNSKNETILKYIEFLKAVLKNYQETYTAFTFSVGFQEPWNIQYYEPGEGYFSWHCERGMHQTFQRALAFMTYLNDVTDGGETEWLYQERKIQPKKGLTAIWPTDFTHTHRGIVSPSQTKVITTGWFSFLDLKAAHGYYTSHYQAIIEKLKAEQNG